MLERHTWVVLVVACGWASQAVAAVDDAADLRRELDALRGDYERRIQQLERRIAELERRPASAPARPASAPAVPRRAAASSAKSGVAAVEDPSPRQAETAPAATGEPAADALRAQAGAGFRSDTEIRDLTRWPDADRLLERRVEDILEGFLDISGYFRAGYGRSDAGGPQRAFGIPGVAKYRLGNEAENYGELAFAKTFFSPGAFTGGGDPDGPVAHANIRLAFYNPYDDYGSAADTDISVPEVWASVANVIPAAPEVKFWAGSRYYRRHDIHINDFYFWDMSGGGGGVEDIPLGPGKFAAAWIGDGAESAIYQQEMIADPLNVAGFSKTNIDLRWYDWPFLEGTGELGLVFASARSGVDADGREAEDSSGLAVSLVRSRTGIHSEEGLHKTSLQFGTGPAKTFTSGFDTFTTAEGTFIRPDPEESWRLRLTDQWVLRPLDPLSLGTAVVYQYTDFGDNAPDQHWLSGGVRPVWHLTDAFSIALEAGVDWVSELQGGDGGTLGKLTLCPQVALGDQFFSRPVIRGFVTYGLWSDGLKGSIGGPDYADDTAGWSWGVQMESWW